MFLSACARVYFLWLHHTLVVTSLSVLMFSYEGKQTSVSTAKQLETCDIPRGSTGLRQRNDCTNDRPRSAVLGWSLKSSLSGQVAAHQCSPGVVRHFKLLKDTNWSNWETLLHTCHTYRAWHTHTHVRRHCTHGDAKCFRFVSTEYVLALQIMVHISFGVPWVSWGYYCHFKKVSGRQKSGLMWDLFTHRAALFYMSHSACNRSNTSSIFWL